MKTPVRTNSENQNQNLSKDVKENLSYDRQQKIYKQALKIPKLWLTHQPSYILEILAHPKININHRTKKKIHQIQKIISELCIFICIVVFLLVKLVLYLILPFCQSGGNVFVFLQGSQSRSTYIQVYSFKLFPVYGDLLGKLGRAINKSLQY